MVVDCQMLQFAQRCIDSQIVLLTITTSLVKVNVHVKSFSSKIFLVYVKVLLCFYLQVYQANSGHYICHNKYYGRRLSIDGVQDTLYQFLHNGNNVRVDLIEPILERLRRLYSLLSKQNTFRFYSSSLLIMYDGVVTEDEEEEDEESESVDDPEGDETMDSEDMDEHSETEDGCEASGPGCSRAPRWEPSTSSTESSSQKFFKQGSRHNGVKVRMIDFAHTTHQGFRGDRTIHSGPDQGYLLGLENLMRMFEQLKARVS